MNATLLATFSPGRPSGRSLEKLRKVWYIIAHDTFNSVRTTMVEKNRRDQVYSRRYFIGVSCHYNNALRFLFNFWYVALLCVLAYRFHYYLWFLILGCGKLQSPPQCDALDFLIFFFLVCLYAKRMLSSWYSYYLKTFLIQTGLETEFLFCLFVVLYLSSMYFLFYFFELL
jgi:hypothetical protein